MDEFLPQREAGAKTVTSNNMSFEPPYTYMLMIIDQTFESKSIQQNE
jgi:hypothetical protein